MLSRKEFYTRLESHCKPCSEWDGACLRGHAIHSPTGCPLKKFPPVDGHSYDAEDVRVVVPAGGQRGGCRGCGAKVEPDWVTPMTWQQVLGKFSESMQVWVKEGMPLVSSVEHERRRSICESCPHYRHFHCKLCKCLVYTKTALKTEYCPVGAW